jgi:hypothetical protein
LAEADGFLRRWSRLKQAERHRAASEPKPEQSAAIIEPDAGGDPLKDLPPLDSLHTDSDYTAFMRPGVPEELRNQALRKLWSSDPVYANLDGLLEYGEDFAAPFRMAGAVATVYRVLEGMPDPARPDPAASESEDKPAPATAAEVAPEPEPPRTAVEPDRAQGID